MRNVAEFCYARRRLVLAGWVILLVGVFVLSSAFAGKYRTDFKLPGSESQAALDLLKERQVSSRTGFSGQIVFTSEQGVQAPAVRQAMEDLFARVQSSVQGAQVLSPYDQANAYQVSADGKIAYAELNLSDRGERQYTADAKTIKALRDAVSVPGLQVELGGDIFATFSQPASEFIGIMAAVIILLVAFGSILAMGLPIITALFGVGSGVALIGLLTRVLAVPDFTTQVAALIGIGVGIDYALLIVTRFRRGLKDGLEPRDAIGLALDTSGRAVVFAGLTVVISLLGMFMMKMDFMRSVSLSAVLAVLLTMLAAVTLLPALMGFVGYNVDRWSAAAPAGALRRGLASRGLAGLLMSLVTLRWLLAFARVIARVPLMLARAIRGLPRFVKGIFVEAPAPAVRPTYAAVGESGNAFWYRWSRIIQAHPWPGLIISVVILVVLAIPVFSLRLGFSDAGNRLTTDTTRRAYDLLSKGFGPGFNGPILVVVDMPGGAADQSKLPALTDAFKKTAGVASVSDPSVIPGADLALINVFPTTAPQDKATADLVHSLRDRVIPPQVSNSDVRALVAGLPPGIVDFADYTGQRLPIFFGAVLVLSFLLLMTVFHSVIVPLKAVIMNMLSIGAAFGAMVAVFQWGFLGSLFGLGKEGPIEAWGPMMMFAIVFGLSMDYEVFLLSRVREEYDKHHDNRQAVADGLASTGRVISAAAAIMVCVFGAFVLGDDRSIKLIGFGLAFAIFIDATLVRLVLVPATMELLGDLNWWMPEWLGRRLPKVHVEGSQVLRGEPATGSGGGD